MSIDRFLGTFSMRHRLRMGGTHLVLSLAVALGAAALVLGLWYPAPYRSLSGGLHLFSLLVVVDVMLGPLATTVVSKPGKSAREWRTDVALIALVQCAALAYGLWTLHQARPVYMAFEVDRLRVVHAVDVSPELLDKAPEGFRQLPLGGPGWVAVRPFVNNAERTEATFAALQGVHLAFRPDFWIPFEQASGAVRQEAKPLSELMAREPKLRQALQQALDAHGVAAADVVYLPLLGRTAFWTALFHANTLKPLDYLPIDPYGE
jgi:hypothetical protein